MKKLVFIMIAACVCTNISFAMNPRDAAEREGQPHAAPRRELTVAASAKPCRADIESHMQHGFNV